MLALTHAETSGSEPAYISAETGVEYSFSELEYASARCANLLRGLSIEPGDCIALWLGNGPSFLEICWGARRSGINYTPISLHLKPNEVVEIVNDSGAKAFFAPADQLEALNIIAAGLNEDVKLFCVGEEAVDPYLDYASLRDEQSASAALAPAQGMDVLYSGGTTGKPKAIVRTLAPAPVGEPTKAEQAMINNLGIDKDTIYLCTVPLYHALGLRLCMLVQSLGGTCVVLNKFDPTLALQTIEQYRVSHSVWVPTMFVRLIKLPEDIRKRYDMSSMKLALHAAAPCPVEIKEQMIDWWGSIVTEFLANTEEAGYHLISSEEWLSHKGSVGRCYTATVKILDDETEQELPVGEAGVIYYADGPQFSYRNDDEKTNESIGPHGWRTVGDMGYLDDGGYLYLTGRRGLTINSGGVKIHPQEVEDRLILHPNVMDTAVIGSADPDFGETVIAIVEPVNGVEGNESLAEELIQWCKQSLSGIKCPKHIFIEEKLPRDANGKLFRRDLIARYGRIEKKVG